MRNYECVQSTCVYVYMSACVYVCMHHEFIHVCMCVFVCLIVRMCACMCI